MSGLPSKIPPQTLPIGQSADGKPVFADITWWLFIYNLTQQVFTPGGGGSTGVSPFDALDAANLFAQTADIPQAYRKIANLAALFGPGPLVDPNPAAQPVQAITPGASPFAYTALANGVLSITGGAVSVVTLIRQGVSVATGITSSSAGAIKILTDEKGTGGTFGFAAGVDFTAGTTTTLTLSQAYGNAADLWIVFDAGEQGYDSYTLSGTTLTFNAAIPVGTSRVYVKGALPSTISASGGLVPVRRLDQVQITYSATPTVAFLPS